MKAENYIKQINASVEILSAQIGNARIRDMWRKDIKTRLSRLNGFVGELQEELLNLGEDEIIKHAEETLTLEGIHDHESN